MENYNLTQTGEEVQRILNSVQTIDNSVTQNSSHPVTGGAVFSYLNSALSNTVAESGVYDVTVNNNNAKFASLSALLNSENLDTLIPIARRKGGMSIKFVHTYDNKYVQYRYMETDTTSTIFTNVANWQGVDEIPTAGSDNLVKSGGVYERIVNIEKEIDGDSVIVYDDTIATATTNPALSEQIDLIGYEGRTVKVRLVLSHYISDNVNLYCCSSYSSLGIISTTSIPTDGTETTLVVPNGTRGLWLYLGGTYSASSGTLYIEVVATEYGIVNEITDINEEITDINENIDELVPPVSVEITETGVLFSKMQNGKKVVYTFKRFGANNLWQLYSVAFYDGETELSKTTTTTDSVGPYQVEAVNNADGDGQELTRFTGGCHGYNGDQTGTATASTFGMKVYCDGKETQENKHCYEAALVVTNRIQGWNTKKADGTGREIIQERITYMFGDDGNLKITNEISALEDVIFSIYYGLQIAFARDYIKFISDEKGVWYPKSQNALYMGDNLDAVETKSDGRLHQRMFLNPFGLGHFGFVPDNLPKAFQSDKAYYNLIRENLTLNANEELVWSGGYRFDFDATLLVSGSQNVSAGTGINISFFIDVSALRGKTISITTSWPSETISGSTLAMYQTTTQDSSGIISQTVKLFSDTPKEVTVMDNANWFWIYAGSVTVAQDITIDYSIIE